MHVYNFCRNTVEIRERYGQVKLKQNHHRLGGCNVCLIRGKSSSRAGDGDIYVPIEICGLSLSCEVCKRFVDTKSLRS